MRTHWVLRREEVERQNQVRKTECEEGPSGGGTESEAARENAAEGASTENCGARTWRSANVRSVSET
jgi:hypothetical protein